MFFEKSAPKKKKGSSTVSKAHRDGNIFITSNDDDTKNNTHIIKIEIFDVKKIANVLPQEQWKHSDYRVKYYTKTTNLNYEATKKIIFNVTKEISDRDTSKKYSFKKDNK